MVDNSILVFLPVLHLPCFFHFLVSSVRKNKRMELIDIANEGMFHNKTCSAAPKNVSIYKPILPAFNLSWPQRPIGNELRTLIRIIDRKLRTNVFLWSFSIFFRPEFFFLCFSLVLFFKSMREAQKHTKWKKNRTMLFSTLTNMNVHTSHL